MEDITNRSMSHRCSLVTDRIKENQKENQSQMALSTSPVITQHSIISRKRHSLQELESIQTGRLRSYSRWPHFTPCREVMSANGWFCCNVNDRVLCIYCNTVCHNWTNTDDPYEVHSRLSPDCPFVLSISSPLKDSLPVSNHQIKETLQVCHKNMCEINRRQDTFNTEAWTQTSPSIEELTQAGFFYSGNGNTVTCFYCGGSLHKWGEGDTPKIEHARWFPDCLYAKHLCGDRLHAKIQMKKKELVKENTAFDKETLARLINARIDLPIAQRLRKQYTLSIVMRCLEDQLKNHNDDFESDNDFAMACFILQKQIDIIQGKPDNMITPSKSQISVTVPEIPSKKLEECLICLTEERQLASMPCGHLCTCVSCGYALRSCPICREKIQSFVRIYS